MPSSPAAAATKSLQSCPTLCDPIDGSPPGSAVPEILQARTLEWLPFPPPLPHLRRLILRYFILFDVIEMGLFP